MSGCGTQAIEKVDDKVDIPNTLLECKDEPVPSAQMKDQRELSQYVIDLAVAGRDCRSKLEGVKGLLHNNSSK